MTTTFESLPLIDLSPLRCEQPTAADLHTLSNKLYDVFTTTGFAYLVNTPLSFSHDQVFDLAGRFFQLSQDEKMQLARKAFVPSNSNTYRGYFPPNPDQEDNLKEGFEVGGEQPQQQPQQQSTSTTASTASKIPFNLSEPNVWPSESLYPSGRLGLKTLHAELQSLSSTLLSLLAQSLGKPADFFASYLLDSVSTLRLLHYPAQQLEHKPSSVKLCCTPHTDSGILTLLHQDPTGGLEVLNAAGTWVAAPYIPGSIVVNIGDLLSRVSGGRFVATMHRVRVSEENGQGQGKGDGLGRLSVPFFFEPGEKCVVRSVDAEDGEQGVVYGEHVRRKMATWVEFQDQGEVLQKIVVEPPPAGVVVETLAG